MGLQSLAGVHTVVHITSLQRILKFADLLSTGSRQDDQKEEGDSTNLQGIKKNSQVLSEFCVFHSHGKSLACFARIMQGKIQNRKHSWQ
jgi:hypothetical protein